MTDPATQQVDFKLWSGRDLGKAFLTSQLACECWEIESEFIRRGEHVFFEARAINGAPKRRRQSRSHCDPQCRVRCMLGKPYP